MLIKDNFVFFLYRSKRFHKINNGRVLKQLKQEWMHCITEKDKNTLDTKSHALRKEILKEV